MLLVARYDQAREILKNRYGNSHLISQRLIADLKNGKSITKPNKLQQLSDELSMALTALKKLEKYSEINSQQSIIDVLHRCQPYIRTRWRKQALKTKKDKDSYSSLQEFVDFIKLVSSEACDPVYGVEAAKSRSSSRSASCNTVTSLLHGDRSSSSWQPALQSSSVPGPATCPCVVCGQNHRLFYCDKFKSMQPKDRLDVVKKHRLCDNCLLAGHNFYSCHKNSVCSVPGN